MKKRFGTLAFLLIYLLMAIRPVFAQSSTPLVLVLKAEAVVAPAMEEYIKRGIQTAEARNAELLVIELNTPGGGITNMNAIVTDIRASTVPVMVYVSPRGAMAASAGTLITLAAHASAMAPETIIGAASPVGSQGEDLGTTLKAKEMEALKATVRTLAARRPPAAIQLAQDTIEKAKAVSANEALQIGLVDFIATDLNDLLKQLNGFKVELASGERVLNTANAEVQDVNMTLIEELLDILVNPNIVFLLITIGVQAIIIEISSPGGWVAGFTGAVCLALAAYGLGVLDVNWFGGIFLLIAFVLFILDVKAPTHGALTAAGIGALIVGALVLFNSPGVPSFQPRVSIPLVIGVSLITGIFFAIIVGFAVRAQRLPKQMGEEILAGKTGVAKTEINPNGQVQLQSELWSAELAAGAEPIRPGEQVEVVEIAGLRLKVRKLG